MYWGGGGELASSNLPSPLRVLRPESNAPELSHRTSQPRLASVSIRSQLRSGA